MNKESQNIEWKSSWRDEYLKWVCGFANAQGGRIEELEYPVAALREMLLNALVHRNYFGSMTQMKVYDERLTLWNAGTLPEELTIEQLFQSHESIPRNPLLAEVCYKAGYIDSWGRGVEKIADACNEAQLPAPQFMERSGGILVELTRTEKSSPKSSPKTSEHILALIKDDPSIFAETMGVQIGIPKRAVINPCLTPEKINHAISISSTSKKHRLALHFCLFR